MSASGPIDDGLGTVRAALMDHLPKELIIAAYAQAGGAEITSGKLASSQSSAALAANAFGFFLGSPDRAQRLVWPARLSGLGKASKVLLEAQMRFPWRAGRHPWLDAAAETETALIGIESKRFEPFRDKKRVSFSTAYDRPVWGAAMGAYERVRDGLREQQAYLQLDAVQLVKHAFGLRTQAEKQAKRPILIYLFAEPAVLWNGRPLLAPDAAAHRGEIDAFAQAVKGAEVQFEALSYSELLAAWGSSGDTELASHAAAVSERFGL